MIAHTQGRAVLTVDEEDVGMCNLFLLFDLKPKENPQVEHGKVEGISLQAGQADPDTLHGPKKHHETQPIPLVASLVD